MAQIWPNSNVIYFVKWAGFVGSTATGLSLGFGSASSRYQKWFASVNVILIVMSICMTFYGGVLVKVYYMDKLDFIVVDGSLAKFPWLPWYMRSTLTHCTVGLDRGF